MKPDVGGVHQPHRQRCEPNPTYQLLLNIARATNTTLGALNCESIRRSGEDEPTLSGFRDWIDKKLATIDALTEPNATVVPPAALAERETRIAEHDPRANPFRAEASLVLRAIGDHRRWGKSSPAGSVTTCSSRGSLRGAGVTFC